MLGADCDDGDNSITRGTTLCYFDYDGDGYGRSGGGEWFCGPSCPSGWVDNNDDCYDYNANAKPEFTGYYSVDRGDGSFDYDCDGHVTPNVNRCYTCTVCECSGSCNEMDCSGYDYDSFNSILTIGCTEKVGCGEPSVGCRGKRFWSCSGYVDADFRGWSSLLGSLKEVNLCEGSYYEGVTDCRLEGGTICSCH